MLASLCLTVLISCGGTVVSGVGSGGSGVAEGTVNGFGSVIVDDVRYDDSNASSEQYTEGGSELVAVKLGQRVRVEYDPDKGSATRIMVLPQLRGVSESASNGAGQFMLLGQRVQVLGEGGALTPTQWSGSPTQISRGEALEVHGQWSRDAQGSVLLASRIERLAAAPQVVLLTAPVRERNDTVLILDDSRGTRIQASASNGANVNLQAGALLGAWLDSSTLQSAQPWVAKRLLNTSAGASLTPSNGSTLQVVAIADSDSDSAPSWRAQGLPLPRQSGSNAIKAGTPVKLELRWQDGAWVPQAVSPLDTGAAVRSIELKGSVRWRGNSGTLTLRGTTLSYSNANLEASCRNIASGTEVYVEISGQADGSGQSLKNPSIACSLQVPAQSVRELEGKLLSVNPNALNPNSLSVQDEQGHTLLLQIASNTLLPKNLGTLVGQQVEIEYQQSATNPVLRKLEAVRD